jgi:NhaA family Na+:H+ antiporter
VFWGIAAGLLVGKTVGVSTATFAAVALRIGRLPAGVRPRHIFGVSIVAGVGFTVALFITNLAFESDEATQIARAAVLAGSLASAIAGAIVLATLRPRREVVPSLSVAGPDGI